MSNRKQRNKRALLIIIGLIILVAIFYFTVLQTAYTPAAITGYTTRSSDANSLTYSTVSYASTDGFTSQHGLVNSAGQYFYSAGNTVSSGAGNHAMWQFYLNMNGIDASKFKEPNDGSYLSCAFSPVSTTYAPDLSSLGFTFNPNYANCYTGNYLDSVFTAMATKLTCSVQGTTWDICYRNPVDTSSNTGGIHSGCIADATPYNIPGTVTYYSGNGFICNVDKSVFLNLFSGKQVSGGSVQYAGVQGIVLFTVKPAPTPTPTPNRQFNIQPAIPITPTPTPVPTSNLVNTSTPIATPVMTETPVVENVNYNNPVATPTPTESTSLINPTTIDQAQNNFVTQFWQNYKALIVIAIIIIVLLIILYRQLSKKK